MRTLAVFLPNWIGDVVMATPALAALRAQYPTRRIVGVCKPYVRATLSGTTLLNAMIPMQPRGLRSERLLGVLARLTDEKVDTAVLFPNSIRSALLAKLAGCREIIGFARYGRDRLLTKRLYAKRGDRGEFAPTPIIDDYNRLALTAGCQSVGRTMLLETTTAEDVEAETFWQESGLWRFSRVLAINPGGAFGASKHWSTESFAHVARRFLGETSHAVVVLCGPSERDAARQIVAATARPGIVSLADSPVSVGLTKAILRRSQMLLTTDSGPRHLATAFDVPTVTLFGPTHQSWTETFHDKALSLQLSVDCGPCQKRVCPLGHHRCMTDLHPEFVFQQLFAWWQRHCPRSLEYRHAG